MEHADIAANRSLRKYSHLELMRRVLWLLVRPLFRFSPRWCFRWRVFLLRILGARVGRAVHVYPTAEIFAPWKMTIGDWSSVGDGANIYDLGPIAIGNRVTISQGAHLCAGTHDYSRKEMPLLKPPITVEDDAWVCADAFVGPGVTVGKGAVIAARAVVMKDVMSWTVVAGNPARVVNTRTLA